MIGWNDVLRFLLELGALVALGYWGFTTGTGAAAWALVHRSRRRAFWALFVAPKARFPVSKTGRVVLGLAVFAVATAALLAAGATVVAIAFGALALLNAVVLLARGRGL